MKNTNLQEQMNAIDTDSHQERTQCECNENYMCEPCIEEMKKHHSCMECCNRIDSKKLFCEDCRAQLVEAEAEAGSSEARMDEENTQEDYDKEVIPVHICANCKHIDKIIRTIDFEIHDPHLIHRELCEMCVFLSNRENTRDLLQTRVGLDKVSERISYLEMNGDPDNIIDTLLEESSILWDRFREFFESDGNCLTEYIYMMANIHE